MLDHGRLATERLGTARVLAGVWSLAGVDSAVTSQTRTLQTNAQQGHHNRSLGHTTYIGKSFPTVTIHASVWLLTGVSANVNSQGASLNEGLVARLPTTFVRPLIGVDAVMSLQIGLAVEALFTALPSASERAWCLVGLHDFEEIH